MDNLWQIFVGISCLFMGLGIVSLTARKPLWVTISLLAGVVMLSMAVLKEAHAADAPALGDWGNPIATDMSKWEPAKAKWFLLHVNPVDFPLLCGILPENEVTCFDIQKINNLKHARPQKKTGEGVS